MGYKIKEMRRKKGMTQENLAKRSGISRTIISGLESGKKQNTSSKTLLAIAHALDTTVDNIFFADSV